MNTKLNLFAIITTILLFIGLTAPAQAAPETVQEQVSVEIPISAPVATLSFSKVSVETTPAPIILPPAPVAVASVPTQQPVTAPVAAQQTQTAPVTTQSVKTAPVAPTAPVAAVGSVSGSALLASARSQLGQTQDCTRMVERALGTPLDLAPAQFFQFGTVVSTPAPGDIIISAGHVGIYSGNGMMISGGFNGNQTVEHPISYVGGFSAVRVA